ncbi:MAG: hypothetical protein GXP25_02815 [Planctomycetes bacterium]|nr:hypothetical protein [Planctomycetota bacterium]
MSKKGKATETKHEREQIVKYGRLYPRYKKFAEVLRHILEKAAKTRAPLAIVQTRPKNIASFAEKIQRKKEEYKDPVNEFTDLCGGRVIVHFRREIDAICDFIKNHFKVDWDNSVDVVERLNPTEFGYRSVHYIVSFRKGVFPTEEIHVKIPETVLGLKCEIQVRTILEHAWADISHDLSYKSAFPVPERWIRDIARLAAMLEEIDSDFERVQERLHSYAASYGEYMMPEKVQDEIDKLRIVLKYDRNNAELADRIGKLAITIGEWDIAIQVLSPYADSGHPAVLRDLGVALCKKYDGNRKNAKYRQGQCYLELAAEPEHQDADAMASLAGTWKETDEEKARELYRRAYEVDPSDAYPLGNYLDLEIIRQKNTSIVSLMNPMIEVAVQRCRDQANVGMNLPWVFYSIGKFRLLQGKPYESLAAYAKAIDVSSATFMIESSLESQDRLAVVEEHLTGLQWVRMLLRVGLAAHLIKRQREALEQRRAAREDLKESKAKLRELEKGRRKSRKEIAEQKQEVKDAETGVKEAQRAVTQARKELRAARSKYILKSQLAFRKTQPINQPIVIVVGGCDPQLKKEMAGYRYLLLEAFRDFEGTVISGGTTAGISGIVGEIGKRYRGRIHTIGYLPQAPLPADAKLDKRYGEVRRTKGEGFTPLEPLQNWMDILASDIDPVEVRVLGVNGGKIAAAEYRIALALGAQVAVVEESGREAARLAPDEDWSDLPNLIHLPADPMTIRAFIGSGSGKLPEKIRDTVAKGVHEEYRRNQEKELHSGKPSMAEWASLKENLKESNRQQADDISAKLRRIGCTVERVKNREIVLMTFTKAEVEAMAVMEHARWNVERLLDGWTWGPQKDVDQKISPYLVSWEKLPENVREWDRQAVRAIPKLLAEVGLEVRRNR